MQNKYYINSRRRSLKRKLGQILYARLIKQQKNARILVILHLYYMEAWPEICEYLKNLSPYKYSLVVTVMDGHYDEETLMSVRQFKPDVQILYSENLGYDVWPFIQALHTVSLDDYDVVFKLQSKGTKRFQTFLYCQYFRKRMWFLNLFEGCLGAFVVHKAIRDLKDKRKGIGLIAAKNLIVQDPIHKSNMVNETLEELGFSTIKNYFFVAGTCFAVRSSLLKPIQDLEIDPERFKFSGFSFAHRLERIICFPAIWEGLLMTGPRVMCLQRFFWNIHPNAVVRKKYAGIRMLDDKRVHIDDQFAWTVIEPNLIGNWEFVSIPVGSITRQLSQNGDLVPLSDTLPYKYIESRDPAIYDEYVKYNEKVWGSNLMSRSRVDALIKSLEENGDTHQKNIVVCGSQNIIWDGQHRCCWLLYKNGPQFKVDVLRLYLYCSIRSRIRRKIKMILRYCSSKVCNGVL